jgi:hypothetical protein
MTHVNRAEFLRRAGAVALAMPLLPELARAASAPSSIRHFISRPDLQPPVLTVTHGIAPQPVFLAPSSGPGQRGALIADGRGDVVWFHPVAHKAVTDFKVQRYRGRPVLTWWEGKVVHGLGVGEWVVVDETYRELARFGRGGDLHEFVISPENTAVVLRNEVVPWHGGTLVVGIVQELELPSGTLIRQWRSLDHVPVEETAIKATPGPRFDYFHVNSIDVAADGDLIVSARNTWAAYKLDRETGRVRWRLGGKRSDFALDPGARFYWQHDVRHHAEGVVTVFDNAAAPAKEPQSRALTLRLDERRRRATLVRADVHKPERVLSHFMGNVQLLGDGHLFVGWGGSPYVTEFAAGGAIVFDAHLPRGGESYRAFRLPWTGHPSAPPTFADGYASWNGATEVASWRLLEGDNDVTLHATQTVPRAGFETRLHPTAAFAAVVALDAHGAMLGRSATVRTAG